MYASGKKASGGGFSSYLKATFFAGGDVLDSTWTKMEFKGVAYDNDSEVDIVTNYRWDVAVDGVYRIFALASLNSMPNTANMGMNVKIYKNGSSLERGHQGVRCDDADALTSATHQTCLSLSAGDYIEVFVHQNTGVTKGISSQANYMTAERIA